MKHEIFKTNPNLKEVHMTSDGEVFYNDNDARMHAKSLKDKKVELVLNPDHIQVKYAQEVEAEETAEETTEGKVEGTSEETTEEIAEGTAEGTFEETTEAKATLELVSETAKPEAKKATATKNDKK